MWATVIFGALHYLNVVAVLLVYWKASGGSNEWLINTAKTVVLFGTAVAFVYCVHFVRVLYQMESEEDVDEPVGKSRTDYVLNLYVGTSIVTFVAAIIYAAS
jgi:hypothetical protein